jgi:ribosomal protein S18 acetylase RimI-like enzyme
MPRIFFGYDSSGYLKLPVPSPQIIKRKRTEPLRRFEGISWGHQNQRSLGGFEETELVGVVGVGREQRANERHMAFIRSMYVVPDARGQGLGRRLLSAALAQAESWHGVEQVKLSVTASNQPAVHLYQSAGFVGVGLVLRALRLGNDYFDELIMVRVMS